MQLCVACSASNPQAVPSTSEKPTLPITFSCGHELCANCARRKSLAEACILCQSAHDILSTRKPTSSSRAVHPSPSSNPPSYHPSALLEKDDFVLGDDSDEDDSPPPPHIPELAPPAYEDEPPEGFDDEKGKREQCNLHYIRPEETLLGLSLKYGVEGPLLCTMNRLPISTLSTTPHLLHTLPFLLLPPHTSRPSTSTTPLLPPFEERKRLIIRRFQVQTRCADYNVARAYVDQVFKNRTDELEFVRMNREARAGGITHGHDGGARLEEEEDLREGGELEEACEAYLADERWEKEQKENQIKGKGKGAIGFGSKIKSTGQVEHKLKSGWSWR